MRKLIVNADGYGFTSGINRGIEAVMAAGVVRSVSCVVNFCDIDDLPEFHRRHPEISKGVHYNLTVGVPVLGSNAVPSLVGANGFMHGNDFGKVLRSGRIRWSDMVSELSAQVEVMLRAGVLPTHWDGHQNKHLLPGFFEAATLVSRRFGIQRMRSPRRWLHVTPLDGEETSSGHPLVRYYLKNPKRLATHSAGHARYAQARISGFRVADRLITPAYVGPGYKWKSETWRTIMAALPEGTSEVYCHPGFPDRKLEMFASYVGEREAEVAVLSDMSLQSLAHGLGVELMSFHDL
jgi:predicted glycoside hydrolase/deacetylase ChbG (UPF0249 family)